MFKKILLAVALLCMSSFAVSEARLVSPVSKAIAAGETFDLGAMQPGEALDLVFSVRGAPEGEWALVEIDRSLLPHGWRIGEMQHTGQTLVLEVSTSQNLEPNAYVLNATLSNPGQHVAEETIMLRISVKKGLVTASVSGLDQTVTAGETAVFPLTLNNDSIAETTLGIDSSLAQSWFVPREISLLPRETKTAELEVAAAVDGTREFTFTLNSLSSPANIGTFHGRLRVLPTIKGKYSSPLYGFPFFTFSILPFHMISSLLGLLLP